MSHRILVGSALERLKELPDCSVQCVVTSPPYWGLRDYGTATWVGGEESCDHKTETAHQKQGASSQRAGRTNAEAQRNENFRTMCGKCGARRVDLQIGLEPTLPEFLQNLVEVFREIRRVLRKDGTLWVNMGDSYANDSKWGGSTGGKHVEGLHGNTGIGRGKKNTGLKAKDLIGQPWRLAFALQDDGWHLRQDVIWAKPNPMPESVRDRCTKAHEYLFLFSKSPRYFFDNEAIKEDVTGDAHRRGPGNTSHRGADLYESGDELHRTKGGLVAYAERERARRAGVNPKATRAGQNTRIGGEQDPRHAHGTRSKQKESFSEAVVDLVTSRNKRSVWWINTEAFPEAHFATFPTKLVEPCILAGTSEKGCCSACGAPWVRIVKSITTNESGSGKSGNAAVGKEAGGTQVREEHDIRNGPTTSTATVGWKATCRCEADIVPCVVADPFTGAGTTALVANRLGRHFVGTELNPEYALMAERRLANDSVILQPTLFNVRLDPEYPLPVPEQFLLLESGAA